MTMRPVGLSGYVRLKSACGTVTTVALKRLPAVSASSTARAPYRDPTIPHPPCADSLPSAQGGCGMVGSLYGARAVLLALTAGNLLSATVVTVPQADFSRTYPLSPTGRIVIQNLYGDVHITAWDREQV